MNAPQTALVAVETLKAVDVFAPGGAQKIMAEVERRALEIESKIDGTTDAGRAELISLAYKIARTKTGLDELGKEHTAELAKAKGLVDADRRDIRDRCDALRDKVRKPVDDWEAAEKARVDDHVSSLDFLLACEKFDMAEPTVGDVDARFLQIEAYRTRDWQEFAERGGDLIGRIRPALIAMRATIVKREADRAELERLRKADSDRQAAAEAERLAREQRERDERIAAEAAERAKREAEEEKAQALARAERAEAEAKAAAGRAEEDSIRAEQEAQRRQEAAVEAERKRVADAKAAEDAETMKRERNRAHRAEINNAAIRCLMAATDLTRDQAKDVVVAIASGKVVNVAIRY